MPHVHLVAVIVKHADQAMLICEYVEDGKPINLISMLDRRA
jgi:hypothetical protein